MEHRSDSGCETEDDAERQVAAASVRREVSGVLRRGAVEGPQRDTSSQVFCGLGVRLLQHADAEVMAHGQEGEDGWDTTPQPSGS